MGKVLTNIKNPSQIIEVSPSAYNASKDPQIININSRVNKNEIVINPVDNLNPWNIKNGVTIWNTTGMLNTPAKSGAYGAVYFNYDDKQFHNVTNSYENKQDSVYYSYNRPNYLGVVAELGSSEFLLGVYNDYLYIGTQKKIRKYNQLTGENIWEVDLSSYLDNTIGTFDKMFVDNSIIFLFALNNSAQGSAIISLSPKTGEVKYSDKIGVVAANYVNMDVEFSGTVNYDLYLYQTSNIQQCFFHKTYNITSDTIISSQTSGDINSNSGIRTATFDDNHNCISINSSPTKGVSAEFCIFNASDASVYLHYTGTGIWDGLQYADRNSNIGFGLIDFANTAITLFYGYGTFGFASAKATFTSSGIDDFTIQYDLSDIGRVSPYQFTQNKKYTKLSSSNDQYYYACSDKFFFVFEYTYYNMRIQQTERLSSYNVGTTSRFTPIIDGASNIIYYSSGYRVHAFRDNSCHNTTYTLTI